MTEPTIIKDTVDGAQEIQGDLAADLMKIHDRIELDKAIKEAAKKHGVSVAAIREEIARRKKKPGDVIPMKAPAPSREKLAESARAIIESENVLATFEDAWKKVAAGEAKNAKLLLLCGTSRLFGTCMNAAIKGPSSCGKSVLRGRVLDFFPPESVISFTTLSEKALLYYRDDFCHKILSMGEAAGAEEQELQDYLLRELMSEGKLIYPVVQKVGEELVTTEIVKNGPVAFQVTTTKAALHPENETRMLSIDVDDSEEQTKLVLGKVAEIVGMNAEAATIDFEPWRDFQRWLAAGNCSVVIPFAARLSALIPPRSVRLRRDFGQILLAIKAHALLHRNRRALDERGQIVAEFSDYEVVAGLMGGIVSEAAGTKTSKAVQQTVDAVREATRAMLGEDQGATSDQVGKIMRLDQSTAWRRLEVARKKGYVRNVETRKFQPGRYRLTDHEIEIVDLLPSVKGLGDAGVSIPSEIDAYVHTVDLSPEKSNGYRMQSDLHTLDLCEPYASPHAYANPLTDNDKSTSYARMQGKPGGTAPLSSPTAAAGDNDPFAGLKDERLIPDLPSFLDRRKPHSSPLSEPGVKVPREVTEALLRARREDVSDDR